MATRRDVRAFDLFCGGGGSSRGAAMAGCDIVGGLDMWDVAIQSHALNFPEGHGYRMKADSLAPARVLKEIGQVDLLLASPECTSHSVAKGKRPGCEMSRATAFQVIRFAKVLQPRWIIIENVIQMRQWNRFKEWIGHLNGLGYHIDHGTLDARYFSTPQSRRRLFVVCDREQEPRLPASGRQTAKTVASVLGRGEPKDNPWRWSYLNIPGRAEATLERARRAIDALGSKTPFIMVYYGSDGAGGFQTLDRPLRTITTLDRFAFVRPNGKGHEMRMLQPTELAAAMGFPAFHKLPEVSRREKIRLIGNAVCPRVLCNVVKKLTGEVNLATNEKER
ncbi:MAG: DNA cytosine methyltransferase [Planctomycetia bacterium]|nr:DNA cytosine methyltransferase [Planctomycetia bacterium]